MGDGRFLADLCFSFVDEVGRARDLDQLSRRFAHALKYFGIDTHAVGAVDLPLGSQPARFYMNVWPEECRRAYLE